MDSKNKIKNLHEIFMFEPIKEQKTNVAKITIILQKIDVETNIYPDIVMEDVEKYQRPPKCIFLPD